MTQPVSSPTHSDHAEAAEKALKPQPSRQTKHLRSNLQTVFRAGMAAAVCFFVPFVILSIQSFQLSRDHKPDGYEWPSLSDYKLLVFTTACFMVIENGIDKLFTHRFEAICREQTDLKSRKARSIKAVKNLYKGLYFLGTSIAAYLVLKDTYIMPPLLGGDDSFYDHFKHYPYFERPAYYKEFFMTCMGYNVAGLLQELLFEDRNRTDYMEMMMHHIITA